MKDLLVLCYPTWGPGEALHLDSRGVKLVLAPDYLLCCLAAEGIGFDLVSLTEQRVEVPAFQSGIVPRHWSEIDWADYRACWHMFRDPTQPEVLAKLAAWGWNPGERLVINRAEALRDLFKDVYLPALERRGLAPAVRRDVSPGAVEWIAREHSVRVSADGRLVCPYPYNNNRGDYRERNGREVIADYVDNRDADGLRSIFRVGYALGRCVPGFRFFGTGWILKSGSALRHEPYEIPAAFHDPIAEAMTELGVDVCHLEGLEKEGRIYLFDINPYPTANGATLSVISAGIAKIVAERLR